MTQYWQRWLFCYNDWHESDLSSFFFFFANYKQTKEDFEAAQSAKAHAKVNVCLNITQYAATLSTASDSERGFFFLLTRL